MKKRVLCVLSTLLLAVPLAACGGSAKETSEESASLAEVSQISSETMGNTIGEIASEEEETDEGLVMNVSELEGDTQASQAALAAGDSFEGRDDIAYVLIYNPEVWDPNYTDVYGSDLNGTLTTGDMSYQIDINAGRAGELDDDSLELEFYTQPGLGGLVAEAVLDAEGERAGGLQMIYEEGDTQDFYIGDNIGVNRTLETLECLYAGEHCYIWVYDDCISESQAQYYGEEFDEVIYPADVETFGEARFTDEGGKINILYYYFEAPYKLGFFWPMELYTTDELSGSLAEEYGINLGQAVIHVNAQPCQNDEYEEVVFSTQAHEFQHLINQTDYTESFYNSDGLTKGAPDTWLNEAMSGYIEEKLYPGVKQKEGHYASLEESGLIRAGQSMYNFGVDEEDIGVYGSVFLFTQYLEQKAGDSIFRDIHDYYRTGTNMDLSTPTVLYNTVPDKMVKEIDKNYTYPSDVYFYSDAEEWVSKMVLDYYLSLLNFDADDPDTYANVDAMTLLYDEINPADIQGGGRVIAATMDGTFEIPDDADYGLIYIGLDADFKPVTGICYK
ncbi:MAG: hypothetical protein IKG08_02570 [Eubacterium sp.]|nr:hypothetical protein [Eubacterium sp.]